VYAFIVPCYNEASRFDHRMWLDFVEEFSDCLFLFVDDGSQDQTFQKVSRLFANNVQIMGLPKNVGKGEAVRLGFNKILESQNTFDGIGFLDADLAFNKKDVREMLGFIAEANADFNACISSRVALAGRQIDRRESRYYIGRAVTTFVTRGWKNAPYDTQSGCKIFRNSEALKTSVQVRFQTRWFFDIELLLRLSQSGKVWEMPVQNWRDVEGSKITPIRYLPILREILIIRRLVKRSNEGMKINGLD
jgi:dolichyl-phosphate beta-glucosyltransferase